LGDVRGAQTAVNPRELLRRAGRPTKTVRSLFPQLRIA
jgi:hypothetical protein